MYFIVLLSYSHTYFLYDSSNTTRGRMSAGGDTEKEGRSLGFQLRVRVNCREMGKEEFFPKELKSKRIQKDEGTHVIISVTNQVALY